MAGRRARAALGGAISAAILASTAAAEPLRQLPIVDRAIEYHGGGLYRATETELDVCSKSGCYHVVSGLDGGLFDHTVEGTLRSTGQRRTVRWRNDALSLWLDGRPEPVAPEAAQKLRDWVMERVYFAFLPYRLDDPDVWKEDLGTERWGERELAKVRVTFTRGSSSGADDTFLYWFDPTTARLEQLAYDYPEHGGGVRFRRAHHHRRVGGILFFDRENLGLDSGDPGLEGKTPSVDLITPAFAAEKLRPISRVELRNVEVRSTR